MEVVVKTNEDLEKAIKDKASTIVFKGDLAKEMIKALDKKKKAKKVSKIMTGAGAGVLAVAGVLFALPTGGASLAGTVAGVSALTITVGGTAITLTLAEVAILSGVLVSTLGCTTYLVKQLSKNYDISVNAGKVAVTCTRKDNK